MTMLEIAKHAFRILASCGVAYCLASLVPLAAGYWALITVIAVMNPAFDQTLEAGRNQVIGTLLGGLVSTAVIFGKACGLPTAPLFIAALAPLAVLTARWPGLRMSCTTLIIVVLVPAGGSPYMRPLTRFVEIMIGSLSAVAVTKALLICEDYVARRRSGR